MLTRLPLLRTLKEQFSYINERESADHLAVEVPQEHLLTFVNALKDEYEFDMLVDGTAVDWGEEASPRFMVVYHLLSTVKGQYIRVTSYCEGDAKPKSISLAGIYPAADWHERECYDMFGVEFEGHPDLRRILMWDDYEHHPLRKEFPLSGIEGDLPADDVARETGANVIAAPMMGGPFTAGSGVSMKWREPSAKDQSWNEASEKPQM